MLAKKKREHFEKVDILEGAHKGWLDWFCSSTASGNKRITFSLGQWDKNSPVANKIHHSEATCVNAEREEEN